jgi:hypothetical protein
VALGAGGSARVIGGGGEEGRGEKEREGDGHPKGIVRLTIGNAPSALDRPGGLSY